MSNVIGGSLPVLLDTDVFSKVFVAPRQDPQAQQWAGVLAGRTVVIAVQTAVELLAWPRLCGWGPVRTVGLHNRVASVQTIPVTQAVQDAFVDLTVWARQSGHGIQAKVHTADRWVAATAAAYGLELAARDGIYSGINGVTRLPGIP